jgi:hypothetical protein
MWHIDIDGNFSSDGNAPISDDGVFFSNGNGLGLWAALLNKNPRFRAYQSTTMKVNVVFGKYHGDSYEDAVEGGACDDGHFDDARNKYGGDVDIGGGDCRFDYDDDDIDGGK